MSNYAVNRKQWRSLNLFQQMGNIGSEVGRSFNYLKKRDQKMVQAAKVRALDLFDATTSNPKLATPRKREILRAKKEYLRSLDTGKDLEKTEKYFIEFAVAARLRR